MISRLTAAVAILATLAGCGPATGSAGLWDLRVGGAAAVVDVGGSSEVIVPTLVGPANKERSPRKAEAPRVQSVTLAAGSRVTILAIDGDDARVRVEDGARAGSILWIECRRLASLD